jgi:hypothetical protein
VRPVALPRAVLALLLTGAIVEWAHVPLMLAAAPALHTDVGAWLRQASESGAVAVLPLDLDIASTVPMLQSLEHRRPIVNGYSGQRHRSTVRSSKRSTPFPPRTRCSRCTTAGSDSS